MNDAYGTLSGLGEHAEALRRRLAHPPETVWSALTEPDQLERWFPTTIDGERAAGAPLSLFSHRDVALPPFDGEMLVTSRRGCSRCAGARTSSASSSNPTARAARC